MKMKRIISLALCLVMGLNALAQGTVTTRSHRLADFTDKVTKIVLPGNEVLDGALRDEIVTRWSVSPFEFCTPADFEAQKTSADYYFLLAAESRFKDEENPGIVFLTLVKGDPEAKNGISAMPEVISLPLAAAGTSSGRELLYLGALVDAVQQYTLAAMESEKVAYGMENWFNAVYLRNGKMKTIWLSEDDLSEKVDQKDLDKYLDEDCHVCDEDEADAVFTRGQYQGLVSYVVAPTHPGKGSYCYKMLFEADSHALCYLHRHKITSRSGVGFITDDLKRIAKER